MTVGELLDLLKDAELDAEVLIRMDGSIFPTDNIFEHRDYNDFEEDVYILATDFT
jgi:hypothetical protein